MSKKLNMKNIIFIGFVVLSLTTQFTYAVEVKLFKDKDGNALLTNVVDENGKPTGVTDEGKGVQLSSYNTLISTTHYEGKENTQKNTPIKLSNNKSVDSCTPLSMLAYSVMAGRQVGVPMSDSMNLARKSDLPLRSVYEEMIIEAYRQPRFELKENQDNSSGDFRDKHYLMCIEAERRRKK